MDWTAFDHIASAVTTIIGVVILLRQKELHNAVNSRLEQMLALVREKGLLEGAQQERAAVAERASQQTPSDGRPT